MTPNADYEGRRPLMVGWHPKPVEGNTVPLYCDECGELECAHNGSSGS